MQHVDVDASDLADVADVLPARPRCLLAGEQGAVVPAEPDRGLAVSADAQHDVLVDLADEHHLRDLDGGVVGHAQTTHELDRHVELVHVRADCGSAAMDDHGVQAHVLEQHDVARELLAQRRIGHGRPAVLDDDCLAVELPDVRQCLQQHADVSHRFP